MMTLFPVCLVNARAVILQAGQLLPLTGQLLCTTQGRLNSTREKGRGAIWKSTGSYTIHISLVLQGKRVEGAI